MGRDWYKVSELIAKLKTMPQGADVIRACAWWIWYAIIEPINFWVRGPRPLWFRYKLWTKKGTCKRCGRTYRCFAEVGGDVTGDLCGYCGLPDLVR